MPGVIDFLDDDSGTAASFDITESLLGPSSGSRQGGKKRQDAVEDDGDDAAFISAAINKQNKRAGTEVVKKATAAKNKGKNKAASGTTSGGGSFQSMGLHPSLLRSLVLRGYTTPTPIQRQAIPAIIDHPPKDLVGMARTGSGKTLAYLIPLIQRLNGRHSSTFGVKSLILCPSRELALQILRVGKEIARGWKADEGGEAIRWGLIVGGEGLDEQFALMATNPDVIIATPGRLLHLTVEMNLDLKSVSYVVFDEADRLFEMGFATQLEELLVRLPTARQTLLFSATLPKSLVDFARAGLQDNPKLVRLDADSKVAEDLRMAFFSVKPSEKEAALLLLLRDVIGVPFGQSTGHEDRNESGRGDDSRKRKRFQQAGLSGADELLPHQSIVFCATKHHVEYLLLLLTTAGYSCSHIYSSLDQAARGLEMKKFRDGLSSLLIVTDVAARGIDLPVLEHVINYDFPSSPRVFVHRVGRTARAGKRGYAWNLVQQSELPFLCDLQLFLARPLLSSLSLKEDAAKVDALDLHDKLVIGTFPREALDNEVEYISESLGNASSSVAVALPALKQVVGRATKMYQRSQVKASQESYRRAKEMTKETSAKEWALAGSILEEDGVHDVVKRPQAYGLTASQITDSKESMGKVSRPAKDSKALAVEAAERAALLSKVNKFRPNETVFEVGAKGATPNALLMKDRRRVLAGKVQRGAQIEASKADREVGETGVDESSKMNASLLNEADEEDIQDVFDVAGPSKKWKQNFRDPTFYMDYQQKDAHTEKGYSLNNSDSFTEQANRATFTLANDEGTMGTQSQAPNSSRWDVKKKKFVQGDGTGSDNKKLIKTESGRKLPASFKSGRFDEWQKEQRVSLQKVGEREDSNVVRTARGLVERSRGGREGGGGSRGGGRGGRTFVHNQNKPGKRPDRFEDDYHKKMARYKDKNEEGSGSSTRAPRGSDSRGRGRGRGRGGSTMGGRNTGVKARSELKDARQIQKDRSVASKRKEKNARPSRKGGSSRGGSKKKR
ncbi:hypothetical protein CBS101457_001194 [Exobasidium rhododendri]|nr:hypothetical protein CBS101457_001194 [Exobasidium rhododendri]